MDPHGAEVTTPADRLALLALGRPLWLTDALSIAYVLYCFVPVAVAVALWRGTSRVVFDRFAFTIETVFFASYVGYFAFPASGPRVPAASEDLIIGGTAISSAVRAFVHVVEPNVLDAFPSGHTAVSLVALGSGWIHLPRRRVLLVTVVAGIVLATVYLYVHYVVDVLAGVALAATVPAIVRVIGPVFGLAPSRDAAALLTASDVRSHRGVAR